MDVLQKIHDGSYEPKTPSPWRPSQPQVLSKFAKDLTENEAKSLPSVLAEWLQVMAEYHECRSRRRVEENGLAAQFAADLAEEFGLSEAKAAAVFSKAWDRGHSSGREEVYQEYADLAELVTK